MDGVSCKDSSLQAGVLPLHVVQEMCAETHRLTDSTKRAEFGHPWLVFMPFFATGKQKAEICKLSHCGSIWYSLCYAFTQGLY